MKINWLLANSHIAYPAIDTMSMTVGLFLKPGKPAIICQGFAVDISGQAIKESKLIALVYV